MTKRTTRTIYYMIAVVAIGMLTLVGDWEAPGQNRFEAAPIIPDLGPAVTLKIKTIRAVGQQKGMSGDVFAKVGDSITAYPPFLYDIGYGRYDLGEYSHLRPLVQRFSGTTFAGGLNSFNRPSEAARPGWRTSAALTIGAAGCVELTPVECEITSIKPGYAIVMFGSNHIGMSEEAFAIELEKIIDTLINAGVVPILSTIPVAGWQGEGEPFTPRLNQIIFDLARKKAIPLINYWRVLESLPNHGLGGDLIHPSRLRRRSGEFTEEGLRYGFTLRNLTFLQTLDKIVAVVEQ